MLISKAMLAVRHAAAIEESRYALNGIHFKGDGVTEATTGHFLIRTKTETPPVDEFPFVKGFTRATNNPEAIKPFVLSLSGVEQLRKTIPKAPANGTFPILAHALVDVPKTNAGESLIAYTTDLENGQTITTKKIDGAFPNTDQVIGDRSKKTELFTLNLCYVEKILKAAKEFGCDKKNVKATFCMELDTPGKQGMNPISIHIQNEDRDEMEAIVMPMRK